MFRRKTAMFSKQEETHFSTNIQGTRNNLSFVLQIKKLDDEIAESVSKEQERTSKARRL